MFVAAMLEHRRHFTQICIGDLGMSSITKKCIKCQTRKPIESFELRNRKTGTRRNVCDECIKIQRKSAAVRRGDGEKQKQYYQENRATILSRVKQWAQGRKGQKSEYDKQRRIEKAEQIRKQKQIHYQDNKKEILSRNKKHRQTIPEKMREYKRAWKKQHKDKVNESTRNRRARIRGNGGILTKQEWQMILEKYDHKCLRCGSTDRIEADHVIPISRGGKNIASNIQPLCRLCNASKHNRIKDYR
jgi:5-methylcytosine-specific restriction endonuclease McrA